ncbi:MAG: aromatic amino acid ammonia-lyase [Erythrobacter sp.]|uniref:aromatic amino acid lyase n=1 Tax=Erythrobacter sp. TaxID=1042 RepID=UPI0025E24C83|nr:aromatic amino acid lyase [Erythrobacter sp.]MCL9999191.1 aromatic amino acid ammonia-lyase [Erythrobacter sp.]
MNRPAHRIAPLPHDARDDAPPEPNGSLGVHPGFATIARLHALGEVAPAFVASPEELARAQRSHAALLDFLQRHPERRVYGIHTYYGADIADPRDPSDWQRQQEELLGYLHVGVGAPLPERVVRRALRLQAMKALQGHSAIHPETLGALIELSNGAVLPAVPRYGSLGASGDLVPMAHAIAPVIRAFGARAPRDVLGLVNTNAMMSALAIELFAKVLALLDAVIRVTALASLALGLDDEFCTGRTLAINPALHRNRAAGAMIAQARAQFLASNRAAPARAPGESPPQPRYSIRCAPQVFGNALVQLEFAAERIGAEALSVADNPVIDSDGLDIAIAHGGLFYTAGLATAADQLMDVACKCAEVLNRQTFLLVDPEQSGGLPRNLECAPGDHVKGIHQLVNALEQTLRAGGVPARNLTSPAEGYNQDIVPGSMAALLNLADRMEAAGALARGAGFIAERAALLRLALPIPAALTLAAWPAYNLAEA